jgi:hypothetical protein
LRKVEGVLAIAARINALFVTDFEPGIDILELSGFAAAEANLLLNGAFQFVICLSLPSAYLSGINLRSRGIKARICGFYFHEYSSVTNWPK